MRSTFGLICFRDIRCSFREMIRGCMAFTIAHSVENANFGSLPPDDIRESAAQQASENAGRGHDNAHCVSRGVFSFFQYSQDIFTQNPGVRQTLRLAQDFPLLPRHDGDAVQHRRHGADSQGKKEIMDENQG